MQIKVFTFNVFEENTYVLYDDSKQCVVVDPGCFDKDEKAELSNFIEHKGLKPVLLLNTHCHIDHILGNKFVADKYGLKPQMHQGELSQLRATYVYGPAYGIVPEVSPEPEHFLDENSLIEFGHTKLSVLFTPGHSPASICFYNSKGHQLIAGDVLFLQSIGRTDLPGGNFETLKNSIQQKLYQLPDETVVYPGHGPETRIGFEKTHNPFVSAMK